jgi:lysozyme
VQIFKRRFVRFSFYPRKFIVAKTTSENGIKAISQREGTVLHGYKDSKGLLTIGVGHLVKPGEPYTLGGKITQDESDRLLKQDLKTAESAVNDSVKVPLSQNQFDALVSFIVNIGVNGFKKSMVLEHLNAQDYRSAADAFMNWVTPPEIKGRRLSEQKQFLTPDEITPKTRDLKLGMTGDDVKTLQAVLKIPVDGIFGHQTDKTLRAFQSANGLRADGIAGRQTRAALGIKD